MERSKGPVFFAPLAENVREASNWMEFVSQTTYTVLTLPGLMDPKVDGTNSASRLKMHDKPTATVHWTRWDGSAVSTVY